MLILSYFLLNLDLNMSMCALCTVQRVVRGGVHQPSVPGDAQCGGPGGWSHPRLHPLPTTRPFRYGAGEENIKH
jgi:hypothetical protein